MLGATVLVAEAVIASVAVGDVDVFGVGDGVAEGRAVAVIAVVVCTIVGFNVGVIVSLVVAVAVATDVAVMVGGRVGVVLGSKVAVGGRVGVGVGELCRVAVGVGRRAMPGVAVTFESELPATSKATRFNSHHKAIRTIKTPMAAIPRNNGSLL